MTIGNANENSEKKGKVYNTVRKKDTHTQRSYHIENELVEKIEGLADNGRKALFVNDAIRYYFSYLEQLGKRVEDVNHRHNEFAIENLENHNVDEITKKENQDYVEDEKTHSNPSLSVRTKMIRRTRQRKEKGV